MAKKKGLYGVSVYVRNKPKKRPGRHKKSRNKHEKRQQKKQRKGWQLSQNILVLGMKEKQLTITSNNITQKQWSNLILELNLIKKAWAGYATLNIKAPGIKKIIAHGTRTTFDKD